MHSTAIRTASVERLYRPHIAPEPLGGWYVVLPSGHGWLVGDRRAALAQFRELDRIERRGRS
jgi:hypothetical protein